GHLGPALRLVGAVPAAVIFGERHDLLLRTGGDRQHGDDRGDAEDHAEHGQPGAQLVEEQVVDAAPEVGQPQDGSHREARCGAVGWVFRRAPEGVFGSTSATSADDSMFSTTATLSVHARTRTSFASKPPPERMYTVVRPLMSNTAVRGM